MAKRTPLATIRLLDEARYPYMRPSLVLAILERHRNEIVVMTFDKQDRSTRALKLKYIAPVENKSQIQCTDMDDLKYKVPYITHVRVIHVPLTITYRARKPNV